MFDISGGKLLLIGVVLLIAVPPKDLPGLLRNIGQAVGKLRRMAGDFRQQFDEAMREADLADAKKKMEDTADLASSAMTAFNPLETIRNEIKSAVSEIKGATQQAETAINAAPVAAVETAPLVAEAAPVAAEPPVEVLEAPPAVKSGTAA